MSHLITVIYKNGTKVVIKCEQATIEKSGAELRTVKFDNPEPNPMFLGLDDVIAIYDGKA